MKNNDREIASAIRSAVADRVGRNRFDVWFGANAAFAFREGRLQLTVKDEFLAQRLRKTFVAEIAGACRSVVHGDATIDIVVGEVAPQEVDQDQAAPAARLAVHLPPAATASRDAAPAESLEHRAGPSPRAERLRFLVGGEQRLAFNSAELALREPGKVTPFYLHGPTGCGKTHFLEMLCREARRRTGLRRIVSVTAEQFTTQFLEALQGSGLPNFRRKFRDVEMLLIDDVHFFVGKKTTLVELQSTIDSLLREQRLLVLAADRPLGELPGFSSDLMGRLTGGVIAQLPYPEEETRRRIVKQLADAAGGLADEVITMLASRIQGDVRQLVGAVNRLTAVAQSLDQPLNVATATAALEDLFRSGNRTIRLADIEEAICDVFGLEKKSLQSAERRKLISQPRMLAMWLARKHTRAGMTEICRYFGRRSHSTVISAERQVERWRSRGTSLRLAYGDSSIEDAIRRVEAHLRTG